MNYLVIILGACLCGAFCSTYSTRILIHSDECSIKNSPLRHILFIGCNIVLWIVLFLKEGMSVNFLAFALVTTALLGLSVIDLAIYEIPVEFNWFILGIGVVLTGLDVILYRNNHVSHIIGFFLVSGIFYIIALATKGNGMGGGDIKLMATVGLVLGWQRILLVMVIGSVLGAVIHGIVMLVSKKEHVLAFGPYLSAASFIAMIYGNEMISWYLHTFLRR